jgi:hypothetical protein
MYMYEQHHHGEKGKFNAGIFNVAKEDYTDGEIE